MGASPANPIPERPGQRDALRASRWAVAFGGGGGGCAAGVSDGGATCVAGALDPLVHATPGPQNNGVRKGGAALETRPLLYSPREEGGSLAREMETGYDVRSL